MHQQLPNYLYPIETRTQNQIDLSTNLTRVLTQLNLHRSLNSDQEQKNKQFLFVCLCGIPPFENQFRNLQLPGEIIVKVLSGFDKNLSQEQYIELWNNCGLQAQAKVIHQEIQLKGKDKDVIFVYHSFGTFTALTFFHLFPDTKVKGIIDLGGAPIRFYKVLRSLISSFPEYDSEMMFKEKQKVYEKYLQLSNEWKKYNIKIFPFQNKYQTIIFFKYIKESWFRTMFEKSRNLPKVLKLFCYGSRDVVFEENLLSEKAVHYCYRNKLDEKYEKQLLQNYENSFNKKVTNIQERFVFNFEGASHSLHMQKRFSKEIRKVVHQYLRIVSM